MSAALLATLMLAAAPVTPPELEPARDALRRHEYPRAAQLLQALADGGNAEASYQLGLMYLPRSNDVGLPPDPPRACRLLAQAAGAAHAKAAYSLAAQVEAGVCKDTGKSAAEWSALLPVSLQMPDSTWAARLYAALACNARAACCSCRQARAGSGGRPTSLLRGRYRSPSW